MSHALKIDLRFRDAACEVVRLRTRADDIARRGSMSDTGQSFAIGHPDWAP